MASKCESVIDGLFYLVQIKTKAIFDPKITCKQRTVLFKVVAAATIK